MVRFCYYAVDYFLLIPRWQKKTRRDTKCIIIFYLLTLFFEFEFPKVLKEFFESFLKFPKVKWLGLLLLGDGAG
jgi:hypothetical protein